MFKKLAMAVLTISLMVGCSTNDVQTRYEEKTIAENVSDLKETAASLTKKAKELAESETAKSIFEDIKTKFNNVTNEWDNTTTNHQKQTNDYSVIEELAYTDFVSGSEQVVIINNNQPSFDFHWNENKIDYSDLDYLNRAGKATAYLERSNVGTAENRGSQTFLPTGYQKQAKKHDNGHLIAYTLSFNFDENGNTDLGHDGSLNNPRNLFTQTSSSNRGAMKRIENEVKKKLKENVRVVYQVTPVFRNDELMARGVLVEAISEDEELIINQYIYNVSDGYTYDYSTGREIKDKTMVVN